ncbi:polysaccharide pyruvyl transferase family protein [Jatrophihabitans fulvus]
MVDVRALILWADAESTNLGVRTLARGTASLIDGAFAEAEHAVETRFQGYGEGDAPVRIGYPRRLARRLATPHDELVDWVKTFDVVVDTRGGDSFTDHYGMRRLVTMSLMSEVVRRARVPLVLGPQTIGPFDTRRGQALARRTLRTSRLIMVRDPVSASVAAELGRPADVLTSDVVFALPRAHPAAATRDVLLNVSGLLWNENPHVDARRYRETVARLARELTAGGRTVGLLAHVLAGPLRDNDVAAVQELAASLDTAVEVLVPTGLDDVRAMVATASVVIGSRMHACLNALSVGRPAIALAYSRKFTPLLSAIGWKHSFDLRTDGGDIVDRVRASVDDPRLPDAVSRVVDEAAQRVLEARTALVDAL